MFKDRKNKEVRGEVAIGYNACENPIQKTTRKGINDFLDDCHEVGDDIIPDSNNKPRPKGDTERPVYK